MEKLSTVLYINATMLTMDPDVFKVSAVLYQDGYIAGTGSTEGMRKLAGEAFSEVDVIATFQINLRKAQKMLDALEREQPPHLI